MTKKFLLVDDSKTILKINSRIISLAFPEAEIHAFDTPQMALEECKGGIKIDFAFLDYNMDEMNGIELAEALTKLDNGAILSTNICIVSANIQEAVMHKAKALGLEFMSKPFDDSKLKNFLLTRGVE